MAQKNSIRLRACIVNPPQGVYQNPSLSVYQSPPQSAYQQSSSGEYHQSPSYMPYQQLSQAGPVSERYSQPQSYGDAQAAVWDQEYSQDGKYPGMCIVVVSDAHSLHSVPSMASFPTSTASGVGPPRTHSSSGSGTTHSEFDWIWWDGIL